MPTPRALLPPQAPRAANRYELVRPLGIGATSEVMLAVAHGPMGFERPVVLKRVLLDVGSGAAALATSRLGREARAYARLTNPAIVSLLDFVEDEGRPTLVLEHVDGLSLTRVVDGLRATGASLDDASAWYLGYRIFVALAAAHAARDPMTGEFAQVIHRDVCPDNVLVPWDGFAKLTDFGVARLAGVSSDTRPGVINGTVGYLAPEQVRGEAITVRTDVYAACLVLRELLLRAPVFPRDRRSEVELLVAMAEPELVPLGVLRPALPIELTEAIDRGLATDPEQRNVTAEEIASLIQNAWSLEPARGRLIEQLATLRRGDEGSPRGQGDTAFDRAPTPTMTAIPSPTPTPTTRPLPRALPVSPLVLGTPDAMSTSREIEAPAVLRERPRRGPVFATATAAAIAIGVVLGVALGLRERAKVAESERALSAAAASAARASAPPRAVPLPSTPPAPPAAPVASVASVAPAGPRATTGRLLTEATETGHRIFVDGRLAGGGGAPLVVPCGRHDVRVGSAGRLRAVDVPCGGDVAVSR